MGRSKGKLSTKKDEPEKAPVLSDSENEESSRKKKKNKNDRDRSPLQRKAIQRTRRGLSPNI